VFGDIRDAETDSSGHSVVQGGGKSDQQHATFAGRTPSCKTELLHTYVFLNLKPSSFLDICRPLDHHHLVVLLHPVDRKFGYAHCRQQPERQVCEKYDREGDPVVQFPGIALVLPVHHGLPAHGDRRQCGHLVFHTEQVKIGSTNMDELQKFGAVPLGHGGVRFVSDRTRSIRALCAESVANGVQQSTESGHHVPLQRMSVLFGLPREVLAVPDPELVH
jgi:hypothetical protein